MTMDTSTTPPGPDGAPVRADGAQPLWQQVAAWVSERIANGTLQRGVRLPPERELCTELGVSRVTLRKALGELVLKGELDASHGRGWFVTGRGAVREWPNSLESFSETAARMGLVPSSRVLSATTKPADLDEAELLHVAPGTSLVSVERVRMLDEVPIALDRLTIPESVAPGLLEADLSTVSVYAHLESIGVRIGRADASVEARVADERLAGELELEAGRPVLVMIQMVSDSTGRPLMRSELRYAGDRYRLRTQFVRSG